MEDLTYIDLLMGCLIFASLYLLVGLLVLLRLDQLVDRIFNRLVIPEQGMLPLLLWLGWFFVALYWLAKLATCKPGHRSTF